MRHRIVLLIAVAGLVVGLEGCANYRAVSDFAGQTTKMTTVVKGEFAQLDTLCAQQAELVIVVNNLADDAPLDQCARYRRTQARFATLTVDVLDGYAEALSDLADDKPFDLSPEMRSVAGKVRGLQDSSGNAVVSDPSVIALTRVADLLADALAAARREEAVRRLAAASPDLAVLGRSLRSFFVRAADAPAGTPQSPYVNLVGVMSSSTDSTQRVLQSQPMRKAEPIRTAELSRELRARQKLLARRGASGAVPVRIVAVIDAWIDALDRFSTDALKPDSREMIERLKTLRTTMRARRATRSPTNDRGHSRHPRTDTDDPEPTMTEPDDAADGSDEPLELATGGETLHGADLQASIDALLAMARSLDESVATATEVDDIQAIGAAQSRLNDQAMALVTAQVSLLAGEVRVTAAHINAAAQYAADVIATMADWKKKITTMGKVVDFFGVVLTGNGAKILEAAVKLKNALG